jgi:hypothetical protein
MEAVTRSVVDKSKGKREREWISEAKGTTVLDTGMVDTRYYAFVKTNRIYNKNNEPFQIIMGHRMQLSQNSKQTKRINPNVNY